MLRPVVINKRMLRMDKHLLSQLRLLYFSIRLTKNRLEMNRMAEIP